MEFLKSHRHRSRLSESAYIALNIALAVLVLVTILVTQSPLLAYILVILSKWRTFAVRLRFWMANIMANLVDAVVGLSVATLIYAATGDAWLQFVLAALYVIWLLGIKPRSSRRLVAIQAGAAIFLGITALSIYAYQWDGSIYVAALALLGYSGARHVLGSYDEPMTLLYCLVWGTIFAELAWISNFWLFAYTIPGFGAIKIPQVAIVAMLMSLVAERSYASYHQHGVVRNNDVILPLLLTVTITIILLIFFNQLNISGVA